VLDASALLVLINNEPGAEKLGPQVLTDAACSTVNLAEVQGKLVKQGVPADEAWKVTTGLIGEAVIFTSQQAKITGTMISETSALGLSLGDRACLSLAISLKAPVYTADRLWKNLKLGIKIHVIR
jgi:PIN domain nuclease of toxin-antitoxin system